MRSFATLLLLASAAAVKADYWMNEVKHQGIASFNPDKSYQVFRNVKDFGAKGDGGESVSFFPAQMEADAGARADTITLCPWTWFMLRSFVVP